MTIRLKQSTASQEIPLGYFVDSTDGNTEETGLTIANTDIKIWKNGATALANKNSGGATHISNGIYYCVLDATDTDTLGPLVIFVHVSGALAVRVECEVLAANIYDSLIGATDKLQVDLQEVSGSSVSTSSAQLGVNVVNLGGSAVDASGGLINANVKQISADATAADNAESFFDGTGYAGTNNVIPTVTNVTTKTGYSLSSAGVQAIWDALTSALTTASSIGKLLVDNVNATISSRLASASYTAPLDAAGVRSAVGLASANLDTQLTAIDDYLDTEIAAIKANTDLLTAAHSEPTGAPAANETPLDKLGYLYAALRNGLTVTSSAKTFKDDSGSTLWSKALSDDGTTYTEAEGS